MIVVCDGVGGWNDLGVDPAKYSRKLCENVARADRSKLDLREPKSIINYTYERNQELGSSTIVVATIDRSQLKVYASYVGDSGYCILRKTAEGVQVVHQSKPQQRGFNHPYQLGWGRNGDHAGVAVSFAHDVQLEDLLVVGTDGLFDNMTPQQIADFVHRQREPQASELAGLISREAYRLSKDRTYDSPFSQEARKSMKLYLGGKPDDITVVVANILSK